MNFYRASIKVLHSSRCQYATILYHTYYINLAILAKTTDSPRAYMKQILQPMCFSRGGERERGVFSQLCSRLHGRPPLVSDCDHFLAWRFYSFPSVLTSCKRPLDACAWFSLFGAYTTPLTVYDDVSVTTWNYKYTSVTQKLQSINSLPIVDV